MTHDEKRMITGTARRVAALEEKCEAMSELLTLLNTKKKGRPTFDDVARKEELQGLIDGAHH